MREQQLPASITAPQTPGAIYGPATRDLRMRRCESINRLRMDINAEIGLLADPLRPDVKYCRSLATPSEGFCEDPLVINILCFHEHHGIKN